MCIGIPMQVMSCDEHNALCDNQGEVEHVDITLVGVQKEGTWLLVFLGAAREVMSAEFAKQTLDAVNAMQSIMQGENNVDHLFADLIDREPELPEHLKAQVAQSNSTSCNSLSHGSEVKECQTTSTKETSNNV